MAQSLEPKRATPRPWVRVLLVISLSLNLLVVGAIGGAFAVKERWKDHRSAHSSRMSGGPMSQALSREDRWAIGRKMRQAHVEAGLDRHTHAEEMSALLVDLRAIPYDHDAVAERLERIIGLMQARLGTGQNILAEHLSEMTAEDRAAYADRLEDALKRKH